MRSTSPPFRFLDLDTQDLTICCNCRLEESQPRRHCPILLMHPTSLSLHPALVLVHALPLSNTALFSTSKRRSVSSVDRSPNDAFRAALTSLSAPDTISSLSDTSVCYGQASFSPPREGLRQREAAPSQSRSADSHHCRLVFERPPRPGRGDCYTILTPENHLGLA